MADRLGTPLTLKWTDIVILLFFSIECNGKRYYERWLKIETRDEN